MVLKGAHRNAGSERNVFTGTERTSGEERVVTSAKQQMLVAKTHRARLAPLAVAGQIHNRTCAARRF